MKKFSSTLYRLAPTSFDSGEFQLEKLQQLDVSEVRSYLQAYVQLEDFQILTELQHYGSETNLIDFTTDYHIALFFACAGSHDKDGRIILLNRTQENTSKYGIKEPQSPQNRVLAQKSIFAQPPNGYIDSEDLSVIPVPSNFKQWILIHLRRFQDISSHSIYNDLHGYIRYRKLYTSEEAVLPHFLANRAQKLAFEHSSAEEREKLLQQAIDSYTTAIQYTPYDATIYVEQGRCYSALSKFDCAIETFSKAIFLSPAYAYAYHERGLTYTRNETWNFAIADFSKSIELNPDYALSYPRRGIVRLYLEEWEDARYDLTTAKEKGIDIATHFKNSGFQPGDFKRLNGSSLPKDLARMFESRE